MSILISNMQNQMKTEQRWIHLKMTCYY